MRKIKMKVPRKHQKLYLRLFAYDKVIAETRSTRKALRLAEDYVLAKSEFFTKVDRYFGIKPVESVYSNPMVKLHDSYYGTFIVNDHDANKLKTLPEYIEEEKEGSDG